MISGIGGALSVIAANAWMNTPAGFTLGPDGRVEEVEIVDVLFNTSTFHEFVHMWVAAYLVAGFLVASIYAVKLLRGERSHYNRLGFLIPFTVAAIFSPIQMIVGDFVARDIYEDQPVKFAATCVYETGLDQTEHIGGICTDGEVKGGIGIRSRLPARRVQHRHGRRRPERRPRGLAAAVADPDPSLLRRDGRDRHAARAARGLVRDLRGASDIPENRWFLRIAAASASSPVLALEPPGS